MIADGVKGRQYENYPPLVRKGILLHRFIDHFTDNHPFTETLKHEIRPHAGKMSSPVVDVYLDHLLSRYWSGFSDIPKAEFTRRLYQWILAYPHIPNRIKPLLQAMCINDWLGAYAEDKWFIRACHGMAGRIRFPLDVRPACRILVASREAHLPEFTNFLESIDQACKEQLDVL